MKVQRQRDDCVRALLEPVSRPSTMVSSDDTPTQISPTTTIFNPRIDHACEANAGPVDSPTEARNSSSPSWRIVRLALVGSPQTSGPVRSSRLRIMPTIKGPAAAPSESLTPPGSGTTTRPTRNPAARPRPRDSASTSLTRRSESPR